MRRNSNNDYSSQIAEHVTQSIESSVHDLDSSKRGVLNKNLRKTYEAIFNEQDRLHIDDPLWWKTQFIESGNLIVDNFKRKMVVDSSTDLENSMVIAFKGKSYSFESANIILVGTKDNCDVHMAGCAGSSRLHAMIYPIPVLKKYFVVDIGSLSGIKTKARNQNAILNHSLPESRRVLEFEWDEIAVLTLGSHEIVINPKTCLVCLDNPRECTFDCKHYVTCNKCSILVDSCPVCRHPITKRETGNHFMSFLE
jgi:hypothetical protein